MGQYTLPFMAFFQEMVYFLGGIGYLTKDIIKESYKRPFYHSLITEQIYQLGIRSFPLILITALSTGMVMTLQFGMGLEKFGGKLYVPKIVSVSILRELGPVFSSLMLAARVGAGIASEIGSMTVTQQIDAIRALGTSPIKKIVIPRVVACMLALPILVTLANIIGILGGVLIGTSELQLDTQFYIQKVLTTLKLQDYFIGLGKSFVFAFFISIPACYYGLNVKEGTRGVGIATTKAVVTSSILIFIGDFFITKLVWIIGKWV